VDKCVSHDTSVLERKCMSLLTDCKACDNTQYNCCVSLKCKHRSCDSTYRRSTNRAGRGKFQATTEITGGRVKENAFYMRKTAGKLQENVRLQLLTVTSMKVTALWDTAPRSLVQLDRRFRDAYCFHQGNDGGKTYL
jgi:hypothetical protein